jgi:hypothetical protein
MIEANNSDCAILILGEDAGIGDGATVHIFGIRDARADSSRPPSLGRGSLAAAEWRVLLARKSAALTLLASGLHFC